MFFAVLANDRDIRDVYRSFFLDNTALDVALRVRARMTFDHLNALDNDLLILWDNNQDPATLTAVFSTQDEDFIILFDWG
jgi:hypothetical protein